MSWVGTSNGYQVGLLDGRPACRNAAGKVLRTVPAALKDDPAVVGLRQLVEWLDRHQASCQADVETCPGVTAELSLVIFEPVRHDPERTTGDDPGGPRCRVRGFGSKP